MSSLATERGRVEKAPPSHWDELPALLTPDHLANVLGLNRKTVYSALARKEVPGARRIGRRYRICRDAVLDWLRGQDGVAVPHGGGAREVKS